MKRKRWSMESVISHPAHASAGTGFAITSRTARTTRLGALIADREPNRQRKGDVPDPPVESPFAAIARQKKRVFLIGQVTGLPAGLEVTDMDQRRARARQ